MTEHRKQSFETIEAFICELPPEPQVQLIPPITHEAKLNHSNQSLWLQPGTQSTFKSRRMLHMKRVHNQLQHHKESRGMAAPQKPSRRHIAIGQPCDSTAVQQGERTPLLLNLCEAASESLKFSIGRTLEFEMDLSSYTRAESALSEPFSAGFGTQSYFRAQVYFIL